MITSLVRAFEPIRIESKGLWTASAEGKSLLEIHGYVIERGHSREREILDRFRLQSERENKIFLSLPSKPLRKATIIHLAASLGCNDLMKAILDTPCASEISCISQVDELGNSALHHCALVGNILGFRLLCNRGAQDRPNFYGATAATLWQTIWNEAAPNELSSSNALSLARTIGSSACVSGLPLIEQSFSSVECSESAEDSFFSEDEAERSFADISVHRGEYDTSIMEGVFFSEESEPSRDTSFSSAAAGARAGVTVSEMTMARKRIERVALKDDEHSRLTKVMTSLGLVWQTPAEMAKRLGAQAFLTSHHLSSAQELLPFYFTDPIKESSTMVACRKKVLEAYPLNDFYLDTCPLTGNVLKTSRDFVAGEPILVWFGEFYTDIRTHMIEKGIFDAKYSADVYDNETTFAPGCMLEDGFPIVVYKKIRGLHGLQRDLVFFAGEAISANKVISWDYGSLHQVKFGPHFERYWPELAAFLTSQEASEKTHEDEKRLTLAFEAARRRSDEFKNPMEVDYWKTQLVIERYLYLFSTPTAQLLIQTKGLVNRLGFLGLLDTIEDTIPEGEDFFVDRAEETKRFNRNVRRWAFYLDQTEEKRLREKDFYFEHVKALTEQQSLPAISDWLETEMKKLQELITLSAAS